LVAATLLPLASLQARGVEAAPGSVSPAADQGVPQGEDPPGADENANPHPNGVPGEELSDQLDRNKGVIEPPPTGDAGIHVEAPNPDPGTTKVIPPPGTPGGDPTVEPK
jgi:hypothetical protein